MITEVVVQKVTNGYSLSVYENDTSYVYVYSNWAKALKALKAWNEGTLHVEFDNMIDNTVDDEVIF